jgi:hypothetical protein
MRWHSIWTALAWLAVSAGAFCWAEERTETFDANPGWDGHHNRAMTPEPQEVRQDFGYSPTRHAGGEADGELGGYITPAAEAAYYAKAIVAATLDNPLTASGKLACMSGQFHVLVGFFNSQSLNEWRTPNTLALRLYGRGDVFYAYVEYCTSRWRAGGDSPGGFATEIDPETGRPQLRGFEGRGAVHTWSLRYAPDGHDGAGSLTVTIDDQTAVCHLDPGHKQDGATLDRFGLMNLPKNFDQGGEVWLDDVDVNGQREDFADDPLWDQRSNRRTYTTTGVRPRFDFGYCDSHFAGGERPGELGGIIYRGDCRHADRLAYYGDRLDTLSLDKPLVASGKICLRRGVSDSTSLIGFFDAEDSLQVSEDQSSGLPVNFVGAAVEGPSREGFFCYPVYRLSGGSAGYAPAPDLPRILPDGRAADWRLRYDPPTGDRPGRLTVALDDVSAQVDLPADWPDEVRFNRFGIVTTWIDGNSQDLYFDDLTYTWRQE